MTETDIEMRKVEHLKTVMDIGYALGRGITIRADEFGKNFFKKLSEIPDMVSEDRVDASR